jgi:phage-related baseplate assembly protein
VNDLPRPEFVDRDPEAITQELVDQYERMTGKTLQPGQWERVFIDVIAYRDALIRQQLQLTGEQNLLAYARFPMLDHLGAFYGVERLPARAAVTELEFVAASDSAEDVEVPKGTRVRSKDGKVDFAADKAVTVPAGGGSASVSATAVTKGEAGNGYRSGEVNKLVDPVGGIASVANTAVTFGGAAEEDDARLRGRIQEAPERLTVAGSYGAYRWHAISAHQDIMDATVTSPSPGVVQVCILMNDGLPAQDMLDLVEAALSDERVRPLTDQVQVIAPTRVGYTIDASLTLYNDADTEAAQAAAKAAAEAWASRARARLGRDIVPNQIIDTMMSGGIYDIALASPSWRVLAAHEWADCDGVTVSVSGAVDG